MPQGDAIEAATTLYRALVNREHDAVSLPKRHHHRPRLHPRSLLRHDEFAAREVFLGLRQQNGELDGKHMLAVQVLMQAVVIVRSILQQKWRRFDLPGLMTTLDEVRVAVWITHGNAHGGVPAVGNGDEMRVEDRPEFRNEIGQGIAKVFVLAASEPMPCHDDAAAE